MAVLAPKFFPVADILNATVNMLNAVVAEIKPLDAEIFAKFPLCCIVEPDNPKRLTNNIASKKICA